MMQVLLKQIGAQNMKRTAALLCFGSLLGGLGLSQTKKDDRGIFVSARALVVSCQAMKDAVGEDYVLDAGKQIHTGDIGAAIAIRRCTGYVEGVADEFRERKGSHYHPSPAGRGELPLLIDTFLKRVAEHPEEANLAASTVLHEADNDVLGLCGDCGFGLLVRSH
jgi:hypothetical protein